MAKLISTGAARLHNVQIKLYYLQSLVSFSKTNFTILKKVVKEELFK